MDDEEHHPGRAGPAGAGVDPLSGEGRATRRSGPREVDLRDAGSSIVEFETWLELGQDEGREELLEKIEEYNRDDCVSTMHLRDWLEGQRDKLADELGSELPRPAVPEPETTEDSEAQQAVNALADALVSPLPDSVEEMDNVEKGRWLLAQLLNWHRREAKSFWWRYFYLANELTDEERFEESDALGMLTYQESWPDPAPRARSSIHRFRFPPQDHGIRVDSQPHDPETLRPVGTVFFLDDDQGVIDIRLGNGRPTPTATSMIPFDFFGPGPKPESLQRLARWVLDHGMEGPGEFRAALDLLARRAPRFAGSEDQLLRAPGETTEAAARRIVSSLDESYLAIQGPPGSGKSTVGAEMIVDLVERGKRVGVTANSHKVIGELLDKAAGAAEKRGVQARIGQRSNDVPTFPGAIPLDTNDAALEALEGGASTWSAAPPGSGPGRR